MTATAASRLKALADQADAEGGFGQLDGTAVADIRTVLAELEQAREMARYAYRRWPSPFFWRDAAQIEDPFTALPGWLAADAESKEGT